VTALATLFSVFTLPEPTPGQRARAGVLWVVCAIVVLAVIAAIVLGLWQLMEIAAPLVR
jgi:CHASE2 domain-containing sensor protein